MPRFRAASAAPAPACQQTQEVDHPAVIARRHCKVQQQGGSILQYVGPGDRRSPACPQQRKPQSGMGAAGHRSVLSECSTRGEAEGSGSD